MFRFDDIAVFLLAIAIVLTASLYFTVTAYGPESAQHAYGVHGNAGQSNANHWDRSVFK